MTKHEFIFSDQRWHRIARHAAFWIVWCLAFNLLFHFPIHVFKGWDINSPPTANLQKLGIVLFFIKTFFINSLMGVIMPQILLTYALIYWLLPNYFFKKRNLFLTIFVTSCLMLFFFLAAVGFKYSPVIYNSVTGIPGKIPSFNSMKEAVLIDQVTTLPIVLGFALVIKLIKRWWLKQEETELLTREKTKVELQLLKAQIHPHFLFNTLNNIYFFTLSNSPQAPVMIKKLSGILHYILNECNQPLVPLDKEIKMVRDYMALEELRYGEQMRMTFEIEGRSSEKMIAPLLLIPFIENSFKHGTSRMVTHPWIKVQITVENNTVHYRVMNSRPTTNEPTPTKGNIGLKNVKKRLELLYPNAHELTIIDEPERFTVDLTIHLNEITISPCDREDLRPIASYEMA